MNKAAGLVAAGRLTRAAERRKAERLLADIAARKARITSDFYAIGAALDVIMKERLYLALGHASFDEMLAERKVMGRTQAYKLLSVVRALPKRKASELGVEKASALAQLAKATPEADTAAELAGKVVRTTRGKPAKQGRNMSVREIEKATRAVRARHEPPDPEATAARRATAQAERALRKAGVDRPNVAPTNKRGRWYAEIVVPLEALDLIVRSLERGAR